MISVIIKIIIAGVLMVCSRMAERNFHIARSNNNLVDAIAFAIVDLLCTISSLIWITKAIVEAYRVF